MLYFVLSRVMPTCFIGLLMAGCGSNYSGSNNGELCKLPDQSEVSKMAIVIVKNVDLGDFFAGQTYIIERKDWASILSHIDPKKCCRPGVARAVSEQIYPLYCVVEILKSDGSILHCKVFDAGQNPLVMTLDDVNYYHGPFEGLGIDSGASFINRVRVINGLEGW